MSYAIGIVAHPKRQTQAEQLAHQVGAQVLVFDTETRGEQWCHQQTLRQLIETTDADWLILIEDDAIPCADFRNVLETYLSDAPHGILSLYLGTSAWAGESRTLNAPKVAGLVETANNANQRWITTTNLWHAVAIAIPAELAPQILHHLSQSPDHTDRAIGKWCQNNTTPVHYTWPSLVDHQEIQSINSPARDIGPRQAWKVHP